jgi:nanoRNase/pAp phosphatase (c-di-AMP/oligoRNAs hydrolase)
VDSQKNSGNITDFIGDEIAVIDHHPTFVQSSYLYAELEITGACASLIARYYRELGITPDGNTASALLYGLRMDTLQFSREAMPGLGNYKLKTVAEKFGIEFNAHRAVDDSYATAQMFLQLIKKVNRLPDMR